MEHYLNAISALTVTEDRKGNRDMRATEREIEAYRGLSKELVWLGCGFMPQASFIRSFMQHKLPRLMVADMIETKCMVKVLKEQKAAIMFTPPPSTLKGNDIMIRLSRMRLLIFLFLNAMGKQASLQCL